MFDKFTFVWLWLDVILPRQDKFVPRILVRCPKIKPNITFCGLKSLGFVARGDKDMREWLVMGTLEVLVFERRALSWIKWFWGAVKGMRTVVTSWLLTRCKGISYWRIWKESGSVVILETRQRNHTVQGTTAWGQSRTRRIW